MARDGMHGKGGGACIAGGVHSRGACMAGEACMAGGLHGSRGACMAGGMHGREGGHAWQGKGGMHGREGGCTWQGGMHGRGHAWQGACMAGGGMCGRYYEIRSMSGQYASYWNAYLLCDVFSVFLYTKRFLFQVALIHNERDFWRI